MKKVYVLATRLMNGTVTMHTDYACFTDIKLAEKVADVVKQTNENNGVVVWNDIEETIIYEHENEVPILNEYK